MTGSQQHPNPPKIVNLAMISVRSYNIGNTPFFFIPRFDDLELIGVIPIGQSLLAVLRADKQPFCSQFLKEQTQSGHFSQTEKQIIISEMNFQVINTTFQCWRGIIKNFHSPTKYRTMGTRNFLQKIPGAQKKSREIK